MAGGELAAVFKGLAEDADQAAGNIAESVAKLGEKTAENEEANVSRTMETEAKNAKSFTDIADGEAGAAKPPAPKGPEAPPPAPKEPAGGPSYRPTKDSIEANNGNPAENSQPTETVPQSKDPIDFATGRVLLDQLDLELPGVLPLRLTRCHRSTLRAGRRFGRTWSSTLDQRIEITPDAVHFLAADGMLLKYPLPADTTAVLPVQGVPWPLRRTADGGHTIHDPGTGQTLHFPGNAAIAAITDRNDNRIDFDYDDQGALTEIRHSGGYRIAVTTADGLITELRLRNPNGPDVIVRRYGYDESGRLIQVTGPAGQPTTFEYDAEARLTRWEDSNGMWYRYRYDTDGRCTQAEGRDGYLNATLDYDRDNLITHATDSLGHTTEYQFNERLQLVREIDPLGNEQRFEWDAHHRLLARTDQLGAVTRFGYDHRGKLTLVTRPDGSVGSAEYDEAGRPVVVTEPGELTWRQEYDQRGNLIGVTDPAGATTTYEYGDNGGLTLVRDALGNQVRISTDPAGLPVAVTDATGGTCRYRRDLCGRITELTDPVGGHTRYTWTVDGKPLSHTSPDGSIDRWNYDGEANQIEHVDPAGGRTHTEITRFDLPASRTGPDGARLEFTYDTELRLTTLTNPQGLVWRYEYDAAGNVTRETDFNGRVLTYSHDPAGRLIERINGAGQATQLRHDVLGNLVERRSGDTVATFEYDPAGRLRRALNADAELVYERDPLGRVLAETCNGRTVRNTYDPLGRRISRRTPSGADSGWSYDARDLPTTLDVSGHLIRFGYDQAGREVERDLATGVRLSQTWDANHRLRTQAITAGGNTPLLQRRSYTYREDDKLTAIVDQLGGPREFDLDRAGQITAVTGNGWTQRYAYDPAGNLTMATWPAPPGSPGDDAMGAREYSGTLIRQAGRVRYQHDAQGRVTLRQQARLSAKPLTWHYTWDAEDRLIGVTTPDGGRWRYRYDPLGRRVAKQRLGAEDTVLETVTFTWDGSRLAEQVDADDRATVWDWEPGRFRPVSQRERTPLRHAPQETIDERFYAIVTDLVGTPTELIDPTGRLAWRMPTTVWGAPLTAPAGGAYTPLRFPGQYYDPESGLNYNYHRYYDTETGRYTSTDPLGLNPAPNPHTYVPNPTTLVDPVGLAPYQIYRGMKEDNGAPKVEPTARGLGARNDDIDIDENGMVHRPPEGGNPSKKNGLSTAPGKPENLPPFRRPKGFGGIGKDPVWSLDPDKLPDGLMGLRDGDTHVSIAPTRSMPFEEYQGLIASTKGLWEKVEPS
jgi:RHS repeat-associated protein